MYRKLDHLLVKHVVSGVILPRPRKTPPPSSIASFGIVSSGIAFWLHFHADMYLVITETSLRAWSETPLDAIRFGNTVPVALRTS